MTARSGQQALGRLSLSEGVGPLPLEKRADVINTLLGALHKAYINPTITGAVIGGTVGALRAPKGEDGRETARNTIGSLLGGALSGAIVGDAVSKVMDPNESFFHTFISRKRWEDPTKRRDVKWMGKKITVGAMKASEPLKAFISSMAATSSGTASGRSLMSVLAPEPAPPSSLVGILGNKNRYSDKDLIAKYEQEQQSGALTKEREQKYVGALRDLYSHADKSKSAPLPAREFLQQNTGRLKGLAGNYLLSTFLDQVPRDVALRSAPAVIGAVAEIGKNLRQHYGQGVVVSDQDQAKTRASFSDDQLRRLLKGLQVKQVQEHAIK